MRKLDANRDGLKVEEAERRRKIYSSNELPERKPFSLTFLLIRQFRNPLIYILLAASFVSFILKDFLDAYVILAAVGVNVIVGFFQEFRAQKALARLKKIVTFYTTVKRDGQEKQISNQELVPGDAVLLQAGNKVPADVRLIEVSNLSINEASLTGESWPVQKTNKILPSAVILAERKNMAYMGTTVVTGTAEAVVVATGEETEFGKIAASIKEIQEEPTPLQKKLTAFSKTLGIIILSICFGIFLIGIMLGYDLEQMLTTAVAIAVAAIPEGLVVTVTVILAIGMQRILKQKALIRRLVAAETLGSTTVICTDKTGTLTEGEMHVVKIITHSHQIETAYHDFSQIEKDLSKSYFLALKIGLLASDAYIENPEEALEHRRVIAGNPTDKALVLAASLANFDQRMMSRENPRLEEIPFDSAQKFMATLHDDRKGDKKIYYKGAPEIILGNSSKIDLDGKIENLTHEMRAKLDNEYRKLSREGLRILALGFKEAGKDYKDLKMDSNILKNIIFVGFVCIKDTLRPEAKSTIQICKEAGIHTVILTGDHRLTAKAIAQELGLPSEDKNIIEGEKFEKLDQKALTERIRDISVYARVNPQDKLRIIDAWQAQGEVVAMTGDGINDAPALKSANIGVALGSGTDVAKETADIVLLDNNFKTIVSAVQEGRIIFDNIKRVVLYLISNSFSEMIIITVGLIIGGLFIKDFPLPLLASQILWVNLIDDGFPGVAMTMEPGEQAVMREKPTGKNAPILDKQMKILIALISIISAIGILILFSFYWLNSHDADKARTIAFTTLGFTSLIYVFSCRSLRYPIWKKNMFENKYLILAVVNGFILQIAAVYFPPLQEIFRTKPLGFVDWLYILLVCLVIVGAIEVTKWYFIRLRKKTSGQSLNEVE